MINDRCKICFLKTYQLLLDKFAFNDKQTKIFLSYFSEIIKKKEINSPPELQQILNKKFCELANNYDLFAEEKEISNKIAEDIYNEWKPKLLNSNNPYDLALKLSIAGNIMDYGASSDFDIYKTINEVLKTPFNIDHSILLEKQIKKANKILYLGDNAGEIVFDKLFIETVLKNKQIIFAVRNSPILNDVTYSDAIETKMNKIANIISNGYDAPSTILNKCSKEFLKVYDNADLIISKGQGNLEGLLNENDSRIFFLLMVKCDVIAEILDVKKGSFIVLNREI